MTTFVRVSQPASHSGAPRATAVAAWLHQLPRRLDGGRAASSLLLAAIVASLLVVANQVIETWTEGHLLAAWIVMWTVAFAALALLASPARHVSNSIRSAVKGWGEARRRNSADEQLWKAALSDARIMADISRAMSQAADRDVRAYY